MHTCIHIHTNTNICMHTHIQINTHMHTCASTHIYIQTQIYIQTHAYKHILVYTTHTKHRHIHTHIHKYISTYAHVYTHMHTNTNTYTHTYTNTHTCILALIYIHTWNINTQIHMHTHIYIQTHIYTSDSCSVMSDSETPWTIQSMEFSRPEYWSGKLFLSPGDLPDPGIKPRSPPLHVDSLPTEPQGKPLVYICFCVYAYLCMCVFVYHSSVGKESACNAGDLGLIPGLGRSPGEGKGYPLQYSGLENSMDCSPLGHKESDTTERLSLSYIYQTHTQHTHTQTYIYIYTHTYTLTHA